MIARAPVDLHSPSWVGARRRLGALLMVVVALAAACSGSTPDGAEASKLPPIDGQGIRDVLADLDRPAVINVWASWCLPCRSEAPLLAAASRNLGGQVAFIGIDVQDDRASALEFIAEFELDFDHYFDPDRAVPAELGGFGTPITYFADSDGKLISTHSGIIDERTLALMLDELTG